ncbi:hypothetical protein AVEN_15089-1 [Araneus ventricosus]|uniref:Uncharacterized protein n=1 Tax=Araneus ventricosus TaxID=182803 RepID=A0A4Y2QG64_ARAVE|nr:hypothetical protein AVEN_15089-1 [Araneus ventricosus]
MVCSISGEVGIVSMKGDKISKIMMISLRGEFPSVDTASPQRGMALSMKETKSKGMISCVKFPSMDTASSTEDGIVNEGTKSQRIMIQLDKLK